MSDMLEMALATLNEKLAGSDFAGRALFEIEGKAAVLISGDGAASVPPGTEADVTLRADEETFSGIMSGDVVPTSAFMTGKLQVDGDMGMAMQLASALS